MYIFLDAGEELAESVAADLMATVHLRKTVSGGQTLSRV